MVWTQQKRNVLCWCVGEKKHKHQQHPHSCLFVFLVDQEEHPHVVCPWRRRRPRSSASQGGLIPTTCWSEGAFETAGGGWGLGAWLSWQTDLSWRSDSFVNAALFWHGGQKLPLLTCCRAGMLEKQVFTQEDKFFSGGGTFSFIWNEF